MWQLLVTFLGVLAAVLLEGAVKRARARRIQAKRRDTYRLVLVNGLLRNGVTLRTVRAEIVKTRKAPSARFETGHFDATVVAAIETLFECDVDGYGHLLNASAAVAHMNRRFDQVVDIERLSHELAAIAAIKLPLDGYVDNMLTLLDKTAPMLETVLMRLGTEKELDDSRDGTRSQ